MAAGQAVSNWAPGNAVMTHPVPLRDQGAWAPRLDRRQACSAETGRCQLGGRGRLPGARAHRRAGSRRHAGRPRRRAGPGPRGQRGHRRPASRSGRAARRPGHRDGWPGKPSAGNRARGAPRDRLPRPGLARTGPRAQREPRGGRRGQRGTRRRRQRDPGGPGSSRLATITSDPPGEQRGITVSSIYVRPDGNQLRELATRFADGQLEIPVADRYRLADAARAVAQVAGGHAAGAVVLTP